MVNEVVHKLLHLFSKDNKDFIQAELPAHPPSPPSSNLYLKRESGGEHKGMYLAGYCRIAHIKIEYIS